ncbi:MAG: hypothetical protein QF685_03840 [Verrucomicrobiota bacterium]|jgi:hypothetical protein|nr:hypothetical protein [Verrucomicrobiota bacterium]
MANFIKNLKKKVKHYKTKAEEIRATIEEGAETIRDIRADVEDTVEDLKADSEEKMMESLEKIQEAERVFKEAGYKLQAVEMEMGFNPKVVSVLKRESEIGDRKQERLIKQHKDNKLLKSMLTSLFKAEALDDKVHLKNLTFSEVHIEVGLVPAVHVLWEDKSTSRAQVSDGSASAHSPYTGSSFTSSRSSFTSSSSLGSSSSFADNYGDEQEVEVDKEEPAEIAEEQPEVRAETEPSVENESEEPSTKEEPTGPTVSASARDPEDDKWTSFPDISFPSAN